MVAKAGLGVIGLGAIGVGGVALAKPSWFGMGENRMPECHYLSEDKDFSTDSNYAEGTFGKKYGRYLVGVTNKNTAGSTPEHSNEAWWKWAYKRLGEKTTRPEKFKSVTQGYGASGNTFLNQVCKEAYKVTDSNGFGADAGKFTKADVWKYCSIGTLIGVSKDGYKDAQIGGDTSVNSTFVSVKDSANDWFWKIRNEDFWSTEDKEWSGSKVTGESNESLFKQEYETNKDKQDRTKTIKEICKDVYESSNSNTGGTNKDVEHAKKFCALEAPAS